ncbi:MAG: hypothetical protein ABIJ94_02365 [candidate division WOR-3 bacterium]
MKNNHLDNLILLLNKIKKRVDILKSTPVEQVKLQPYQFEKHIDELKRILNEPMLIEYLGTSKLSEELKAFVQQQTNEINKYKEEYHFQIGTKLKEQFQGFGEIKGQLPILRVKFYTIVFDFNNGEASIWWGPEKELIRKVALDLTTITQTIRSFDESLKKMWQKIDDFYNTIKLAYERNTKINNLPDGTKVNLLDILAECTMLIQNKNFKINPVKSHFTEYSRIQFSYDLYCLKTASNLMNKIQLSVATFAITEKKEKSIWVPDNETGDGTYYQTIAIK